MRWLNAAALLFLSACGPVSGSGDLKSALSACARGASHTEVHLSGIVNKLLGTRPGPSGAHEGFILLLEPPVPNELPTYKVEDNADITGYIPLQRGDRVELQGQFECNDRVIHWTHHDPAGRHAPGYINVDGRSYQ